jgi:hypothetical protein
LWSRSWTGSAKVGTGASAPWFIGNMERPTACQCHGHGGRGKARHRHGQGRGGCHGVVRPQLGVAAPSTFGTDGEEAWNEWIDEEKAWPAWEEGRRWTQRGLTPASRGLEQATMAAACGRDETPRRRRCRSRGASSGLVVVSQLRQWRVSGRGRPMVDRGRWQCVGEPAVPTARGDAARRGVERLQPGRAGARLGDMARSLCYMMGREGAGGWRRALGKSRGATAVWLL